MTLLPWLDIARPRPDIADGSFDESLFAADLGSVAQGIGPSDYLDPRAFCEKTYLTTNLRAVLVELGNRLAGLPSAAGVYRLQTEFGGGKTHTLLSAYHLFRAPDAVAGTEVAKELAALLPGKQIPKANVVVLDGSALTVGTPEQPEPGLELTTLYGHLAYQLGGRAAWQAIAKADVDMLGASTVTLARLLAEYAPCLILLDETLEYLNKALAVPAHDGNLAGVTLTFIKELASAVANTPGVALLATLTSSRMEDYAEVAGQEMQERLSNVVGRSENIVTPVEGDDIFPILHRRLFTTVGARADHDEAAESYSDYYASMGDALPATYSEQAYRERISAAYPFHPELVDILTNRWGSLSGFQRTRGALRTLAHTVKALSQKQAKAALIHPGDMPLDDVGVRAEVLKFAGDSFKAALNADIIRPDSKAVEEDNRRGGQAKDLHLASALATTAFLDSFGPDKVLGASAAQLTVGAGRPGLSRGLLEDVRDSLESQLWYMRLEGGRYRFTTEPNLNKVVLEREAAIADTRVSGMVRDAIRQVAPDTPVLRTVGWVHDSTDLADEARLTLGVLDFDHRINGEGTEDALRFARTILEQRGSSFRANKNSVMLLVTDGPALAKARGTARTLAALTEVAADNQRLKRFNAEQKEQLAKRVGDATERLPQQVVMAYRHLTLLGETDGRVDLDRIDLGPARAGTTLPERVLDYLRGADRIIEKLAPAALVSARFGLLPDGTDAIELDRLFGWFSQLTRLPKLAGPQVLRDCLVDGVRTGVFGLVSGSSWDADDAVVRFNTPVDPGEVLFQPGVFLVRAAAVKDLLARRQGEPTAAAPVGVRPEPNGGAATAGVPTGGETASEPEPDQRAKIVTQVTLTLRGVPASKARDVVKVAILPLSAVSSEVRVDMTITADGGLAGISRETLDLVVAEGLRQLGLGDAHIEILEQ
jgi:hypothetical protein